MLNRPKIVYLAIKNRLLHVICRLLSTARGLREVFCVCNFADYVKVPQIWSHQITQISKHIYETLSPGICLTRASVT